MTGDRDFASAFVGESFLLENIRRDLTPPPAAVGDISAPPPQAEIEDILMIGVLLFIDFGSSFFIRWFHRQE